MTEDYLLINYILPILGLVITAISQFFVTMSYNKYKGYGIKNNITGMETARKILDANGLKNVKIQAVSGNLTDHYDPKKKTVNLSQDIYSGSSIASISVAAHECGHAIQDKENYLFLKIRSSLVPLVNFSTKIGYIVVVIGLIFNALKLAELGLILLLGMLLFQLVTLPVEFNASRRALKQIEELSLATKDEKHDSKIMLVAAAFTYVASLMSTLLQILRLALTVLNRRDN